MALKHGNKSYYQVLIDPNRAELIEKLADKLGIKSTFGLTIGDIIEGIRWQDHEV